MKRRHMNSKEILDSLKTPSLVWILLGCAVTLGTILFLSREQPPVVLRFCVEIRVDPPKTSVCSRSTEFVIPAEYFNFIPKSDKPQREDVLQVAYPSMRPWKSLSSAQRNEENKVEITLQEVFSPRSAKDFRFIGYAKDEYVLEPKLHYGLENYALKTRWSQVLLPVNPERFVKIHCPYAKTPEEEIKFLCRVYSYVPFNFSARPGDEEQLQLADLPYRKMLAVQYRYQQMLLPEWQSIQRASDLLIRSFEKPQD
jgi:hypothetical protein